MSVLVTALRGVRWTIAALSLALVSATFAGCGGGGGSAGAGSPPIAPPPPPPPPVGLAALSDEFDDPASLDDWQRVFEVEGWPYDQLEAFDANTTRAGWLTMVPYASTWYQDYRGELTFKPVTGDFVVTTHVEPRNRAGTAAPNAQFSLAGIMVRAARTVTPATWTAGHEDYVFLSLGAANTPGTYQTEVKTTDDSDSILEIAPGPAAATLRAARIGPHLILLIRPEGGAWAVHRRYRRDDFPATLQVGLTVYTDWLSCAPLGPVAHNNGLITDGDPDLRAQFDYVRWVEPAVPVGLVGADLSNPATVTDAQLLAFLAFDA